MTAMSAELHWTRFTPEVVDWSAASSPVKSFL